MVESTQLSLFGSNDHAKKAVATKPKWFRMAFVRYNEKSYKGRWVALNEYAFYLEVASAPPMNQRKDFRKWGKKTKFGSVIATPEGEFWAMIGEDFLGKSYENISQAKEALINAYKTSENLT